MKQWKTLSKKNILTHSAYLQVEEHTLQLPDGQIIEDWPWVITPDYVNIAVITESSHFLCFKQTKYAVQGISLAPVGGYIDIDELPLQAAQRELLEETGHTAPDWQSLGQYAVDGNRGAGTAHFFLAQNAHQTASINADDLEEQELVSLTRSELEQALAQGQFKVLPWASVMALALLRL